ncbi:MAG: hypothetical protein Q9209_003153 [Squamulea sp. 1 TL-2023]
MKFSIRNVRALHFLHSAKSTDGCIVNLFTAELAHDCLISTPFNATGATQFHSYYKDTLQFQSTLAYLKKPPSTYKQPSVDLLGILDSIQRAVDNGEYKNEYDFEAAVQQLIYATHDAHIPLYAGALSVFTFGAPVSIVSVSTDGIAYPNVFVLDDLLEAGDPTIPSKWVPSAIATLNGVSTMDFLKRDSVRKNDPTPLQFQDLPADCRIYYTVSTVYNLDNLWNYVIDAITASNFPAAAPAKLSERSTDGGDLSDEADEADGDFSTLENRALITTFENDFTFTPSAQKCTKCPNARESCTEVAYCDRGQRNTFSACRRKCAGQGDCGRSAHCNSTSRSQQGFCLEIQDVINSKGCPARSSYAGCDECAKWSRNGAI